MKTAIDNQRTLNRTGAAVAIMLLLILAGAIYALAKWDLPQANHDILLVLITAVATNITSIVQWFFGSSASTKAKDDTINTMATTTAQAQAALAPLPGAAPVIPVAAGEAVTVKADP